MNKQMILDIQSTIYTLNIECDLGLRAHFHPHHTAEGTLILGITAGGRGHTFIEQ